jgi:hypothetical protein
MPVLNRFLIIGLATLIACNNTTQETTSPTSPDTKDANTVTPPSDNKDTTIGGCYSQVYKRDTVTLQIDVKGNNVTGPLTYKIFQKDRNDGSIKAVLADSVISGWYLFRSEGIMSVRQIAWRVKPGRLLPAMGEMVQRNDTTMFVNADRLQFDNSKPFVKTTCTL